MGTVVRVPDIGDANDVEVIELCCAVGDVIAVGDALIVLESDKASMEVPSEVAGTLTAFNVAVGDKVEEGQAIAEIDAGEGEGAEPAADATGESEDTAEADEGDEADEADEAADAVASEPEAEAADDADEDEGPADEEQAAGGASTEVRVPDIGDATDVTVVEICVAVGATVEKDESLVVLESDKASMEIGAPAAGTVSEIKVAEGDSVAEGTLIAVLVTAGGAAQGKAAKGAKSAKSDAGAKAAKPDKAEKSATADKSDKAAKPEQPAKAAKAAQPTKAAPEKSGSPREAATEQAPSPPSSVKRVYAGPAVRRLARELGVDLTRVTGSGARGRVIKEDVQTWVKAQLNKPAAAATSTAGAGIPPVPVPDFTKFGEVELQPLTRVMKVGGANLHRSWLNLPHVTHNDEADITDLEAFRASLKAEAQARDVRLTPLAFMVKACVYALKEHPRVNSSLDAERENFVYKKYYNIGMAVDTPDGLMVPVIRGADHKSIWEIATDIIDLSVRARDKKLRPDDMSGGTFSISSLGALGGTSFTPIINAPEVAILGVAKTATRPMWDGSTFVPRQMLPLSLSYDHRAINGADAARFTTTLVQVLSDIRRLALM